MILNVLFFLRPTVVQSKQQKVNHNDSDELQIIEEESAAADTKMSLGLNDPSYSPAETAQSSETDSNSAQLSLKDLSTAFEQKVSFSNETLGKFKVAYEFVFS